MLWSSPLHFYANLLDSLFTFFRNVFAVFGIVFGLMLVLEWRRGESPGGHTTRAYANPEHTVEQRYSSSQEDFVEASRLARDQARQILRPGSN